MGTPARSNSTANVSRKRCACPFGTFASLKSLRNRVCQLRTMFSSFPLPLQKKNFSVYGNRMQGKFIKKLTGDIFELRVKQFDRIFRVLFFYQPGMLIVITSWFQKKTEQTPPGEVIRADQLRKLWMRYRNRYTGSQKEKEAILKELGL